MKHYPAIQTNYANVAFRSRLEARWAAMFDLLELRWEYEPIDLEGYIPDFYVLAGAPVLVEVKPILWAHYTARHGTWPDTAPEAVPVIERIRESGWSGQALVLGASLGPYVGNLPSIGVCYASRGCLVPIAAELWSADTYDERNEQHLHTSYVLGLSDGWRSWQSRSAPRQTTRADWVTAIWREAGNRVQWMRCA